MGPVVEVRGSGSWDQPVVLHSTASTCSARCSTSASQSSWVTSEGGGHAGCCKGEAGMPRPGRFDGRDWHVSRKLNPEGTYSVGEGSRCLGWTGLRAGWGRVVGRLDEALNANHAKDEG